MLTLLTFSASARDQVDSVRVWPAPDSTRIVLDLSAPIKYSYFTLSNPNRLVLDLQSAYVKPKLSALKFDSNIVRKIRHSAAKKKGDSRIVFDLNSRISPIIFALKPTAPYGDRLVIDLTDPVAKATKNKIAQTPKSFVRDRDIVIAIDAGHGGEDPGSIGGKGNYEKKINLAIAKKLSALITKEKGMKVVMTRAGDYYVSVHKRTETARNANADLLISIHADAFTSPKPSGASVWVLSLRRANSEVGKWLEKKEKHSQLLGGAAEVIRNTNSEKYLARTLLDMSMDHSMEQGYGVAESILGQLKDITKLHKKTPQAASLGVLKSPDIPSILVETGFLSNPREESMLTQPWHQNRVASSIFTAVKAYFLQNAPDGTYFARNRSVKHKVKRGESLSVVAQNYNVSVSQLKKANKLTSNTIRIGQVLSIPRS